MTSLMLTFRTFSFLDFLADVLQKTISVAIYLFACCEFSVHVPYIYMYVYIYIYIRKLLALWGNLLLHVCCN
jgi:hypothetical protein